MSRALSSTFVEAVNAAETDEAFLVLVKIDDADLDSPIRVTSDAVKTYSADQDSDVAADSTSNNNDGTLQNDPQWTSDEVTDRIVGALSFDGVDDRVNTGTSVDLDGVSFTVEAWIRADSVSGQKYILGKHNAASKDNSLQFGIVSGAATIRFYADDLNGSTTLNMDTWYHIAGTFEASTNEQRIYVNGEIDGSRTADGALQNTNDDPLEIGRAQETNTLAFPGDATDVRVWNTARTQQQIQDNMNKRLNGNESGLVGYWRLDDTVNTYEPFPFEVELPDDTDDMGGSLARLRMDAVDRRVVEAVRRVSGVPEVTLEVVLASDPDTVEISWPVFSLSNARYGDQAVEADLTLEVLDQEPFPGPAFNPALFPGLYLLAVSVMVNVWTSIGNEFLAFLAT